MNVKPELLEFLSCANALVCFFSQKLWKSQWKKDLWNVQLKSVEHPSSSSSKIHLCAYGWLHCMWSSAGRTFCPPLATSTTQYEVSCHSRNDWLSENPLKITKYIIIMSTIMFILMTTFSLAWESAGQIWSLRIGNLFGCSWCQKTGLASASFLALFQWVAHACLARVDRIQ